MKSWMIPLLCSAMALLGARALGAAPEAALRMAVFKDAGVPIHNSAPSDPGYLARLAREAGWDAAFVTAAQMADPKVFSRERFDVVILPYGESFPSKAAENFRKFALAGGSFFSTGGYAFNSLYSPEGPAHKNLLGNGGFEEGANGWKGGAQQPAGVTISVVEDAAHSGAKSAHLKVESTAKKSFYAFTQEISAPKAGAQLQARAWIRARGVRDGYAYAAITFWRADGTRMEQNVRQTGKVLADADWTQVFGIADVPKGAVKVRAGLLLYAFGEAWFDDVELTESERSPLNTRLGDNTRAGILHTAPQQIGVFDDGYLLREVTQARAADGQNVVASGVKIAGALEGWAACAIIGMAPGNNFASARRWVPLLIGYNEAGEEAGPVLAIVYNYAPPFAGGVWAFAGVTNRDLFAPGDEAMAGVFKSVLDAMRRKTFIRMPETDLYCYRQGEAVAMKAVAENLGAAPQQARVTLRAVGEDNGREVAREEKTVALAPGKSAEIAHTWKPERFEDDFYTVEAAMTLEGKAAGPADREATGFCVWDLEIIKGGFPLKWRDNYLCAGDRPVFVTGSNQYGVMFQSPAENPLTWRQTFSAMRDHGLRALRVLSLSSILTDGKSYQFDWSVPPEQNLRRADALVQMCQKYQVALFPTLVSNGAIALPQDALENERRWDEFIAKRYADVPGLMFDIHNEPIVLGQIKPPIPQYLAALYRDFLKERYKTDEAFAAAYNEKGLTLVSAQLVLSRLPWDSRAGIDREEFAVEALRRWTKTNAEGAHKGAPGKPVTVGFLPTPTPADMWLASEFTDFSNYHAYVPYGDFRNRFKFTDQRVCGRGLSIGEFGIAVNPGLAETAIEMAQTAKPHWLRAGEAEWRRAIDWYVSAPVQAFALGGSMACNWHLNDPDAYVFDFGLFHSGHRVARTTVKSFRAASLLLRSFAPAYMPPSLYYVIPDNHRVGGGDRAGISAAIQNGIDLLIGCGVDFALVNESSLDKLPREAKALFWAMPFCPDDAVVERLEAFVKAGGMLFVTGDFSYDHWRQRNRTGRLKALAGVEFVRERYPNIECADAKAEAGEIPLAGGSAAFDFAPCIEVHPAGATVLLTAGGQPVLSEYTLGKGKVWFTPEPVELRHEWNETALYNYVLDLMKIERLPARPLRPETPALRQATRDGEEVYVVCNRSETTATVELARGAPAARVTVSPRREALVAFDKARKVIAACVEGKFVYGGGQIASDDRIAVMSADKRPLNESRRLVVFLLGATKLGFDTTAAWKAPVAEIGEIVDARWRPSQSTYSARHEGGVSVTAPPVHRYKMVLIAESSDIEPLRAEVASWIMPPR